MIAAFNNVCWFVGFCVIGYIVLACIVQSIQRAWQHLRQKPPVLTGRQTVHCCYIPPHSVDPEDFEGRRTETCDDEDFEDEYPEYDEPGEHWTHQKELGGEA